MGLKGLVIAAPHSGAGKTLVTLGLLRALRARGLAVVSAKSGPDYIDPAFHAAASGADCVNLDGWAMGPEELRALAARDGELLVVEGAMGLFDGAPDADDPMGRGSVADVAAVLGLPVVLVLDVAKQAQTAAAVVAGLAGLRGDVRVAGVILNRVGSPRHGSMVARAIAATGVPVLGQVARQAALDMPSRHLGLVQAGEYAALEDFIDRAAALVGAGVDLDALLALAGDVATGAPVAGLAPLGQRIAVARDAAFAFAYPHMLAAWRRAGAEVSFFSPLADEGPAADADAVFLPGGYPELHAGRLADCDGFRQGMAAARDRGALLYGECGGYMALGRGLVDGDGQAHRMLGFLPVETSFARRRLHLGYRDLRPLAGLPWRGALKGHEFHYATHTAAAGPALFGAADSLGADLPDMGQVAGRVCGSFAHVISQVRAQKI